MSLRWGLGAGAISAILGLLALFIGALVEPIHTVSNAYAVALALFVRGLLALLALAMALTLAYYAGWQVEAWLAIQAEETASAGVPTASGDAPESPRPTTRISAARTHAALAGAIALVLYWLVTTLYIVTLGSRFGGVGAQGVSPLTFALSHLVQGIVFVGLGAGAGGLGGRAAAARRLLQRLTTMAGAAPDSRAATSPTSTPPANDTQSPPPDSIVATDGEHADHAQAETTTDG